MSAPATPFRPTMSGSPRSLARQYALPLLSNDTHFDRVDGVERIAF